MNQAQEQSLPTSNEELMAEITALTRFFLGQCADHHHNVALSALLTAYKELAIRNPCCTEGCVKHAVQTAMQLARHASQATQAAPEGASIH